MLQRSIILACSFLVSLSTLAAPRVAGKVTKISDGDTIHFLQDGGTTLKLRFEGMDTAETTLSAPGGTYSQGFWGEQAKKVLTSMIPVGTRIEVALNGLDDHGRSLGRVFKDGVDVNQKMIESGWAVLYDICAAENCQLDNREREFMNDYRKACAKAVRDGLGIFDAAKPLPELPFLFRSRIQRRPLSKVVGDVKTGKYVAPAQYAKVDVCDRLFFMEEKFAAPNGYRPE